MGLVNWWQRFRAHNRAEYSIADVQDELDDWSPDEIRTAIDRVRPRDPLAAREIERILTKRGYI